MRRNEILRARFLGEAIAQQRIDHAPTGNDKGEARFGRGGPHPGQQDQVPAARRAEAADPVGPSAVIGGVILGPADARVDIVERRGITPRRRHAEIERDNEDSGIGQHGGDGDVLHPVAAGPGAAMQVDHDGKRAFCGRAVEPREQLALLIAVKDDVFDGGGGHASSSLDEGGRLGVLYED